MSVIFSSVKETCWLYTYNLLALYYSCPESLYWKKAYTYIFIFYTTQKNIIHFYGKELRGNWTKLTCKETLIGSQGERYIKIDNKKATSTGERKRLVKA